MTAGAVHEVTLLPGEGPGLGIAGAARRVLEATGVSLRWDEAAGEDDAIASLRRTRVGLSPAASPAVREALELRTALRPRRAYEGVRTRFPETDVILVCELAEAGDPGLAFRDGEGILRAAFALAGEQGRGKVTAAGPGAAGAEVAADHAEIPFEAVGVGALCRGLVAQPDEYDVIVLPSLHGEVLGEVSTGMVGGSGVAAGACLGPSAALFEGAGAEENPAGLLLSGVLMLRHLDESDAAGRLEAAVAAVIRRGESVTPDLKPTRNDPSAVGTEQFADAVIEEMNQE